MQLLIMVILFTCLLLQTHYDLRMVAFLLSSANSNCDGNEVVACVQIL
jgi:hypothetical protein